MPERFRLIPPLLAKALLIALLIALLLIPISQVESLVGERVGMRDTAAQRVAESWGGPQTTAGVLLAIPIDNTRVLYGSRTEVEHHIAYVLPDNLRIEVTRASVASVVAPEDKNNKAA